MMEKEKKKIIIDSDCGSDDAMAHCDGTQLIRPIDSTDNNGIW